MRLIKNIPSHFFVVNIVTIVGYFFVLSLLKIGINPEIMYSSSDAGSYMDVANWIASGKESIFVEYRPFLFPLILLILSKIGGATAIWFFQFVLWLLSINILFKVIRMTTGKIVLAYFGIMILILNLTVIALTLHALTEVTSVFLLTYLLYFFLKNITRRKELYFIHGILLFFVILTLIKPAFFLPFLFILGVITPVFYWQSYFQSPVKVMTLLLILLPLIGQITIMKVKYDSFSVSNISERTFTRYILAKGIQKIENIEDRNEAIVKAESFSTMEKKKYFMDHIRVYNSIFWSTIEENIKAESIFLRYPAGYENHNLAKKMKSMNENYYSIHLLFLPLSVILFFLFLYKKKRAEAIVLFSVYSLCAYYIFVSGISFFQGDRLVIAVITLWIFVYLFVIHNYLKLILRLFKRHSKLG